MLAAGHLYLGYISAIRTLSAESSSSASIVRITPRAPPESPPIAPGAVDARLPAAGLAGPLAEPVVLPRRVESWAAGAKPCFLSSWRAWSRGHGVM